MRKKVFTILLMFVFLGTSYISFAQRTVTGTISSDSETGIPGVTVLVKGTNIGTISDINGKYNISVPAGREFLTFSYIGMKTQEVKINGSQMDVKMVSEESDIAEVLIVAQFAKDRSTPVAFTTIKPEIIEEKLGTQEFPEILKSSPSVYATKTGGGRGDGRINMRGFDGNNIGVLINGIPVNDMEWGKVYWSNWAGLSDVTKTMQVQRGLGYSKLALSSVGGTINIITKTTDAEKGGSVFYGIGNDNHVKKSFTISTGLTEKGWAITASGSMTTGDGYAVGTNYKGYSYFLNISKRLSNTQTLSLTGFGAPQWHNQRGMHNIEEYRNSPDGRKHNANTGFRNGKVYNGAYAFNKYHKPQISLNHSWDISDITHLSTAIYTSIGRGYGRRMAGSNTQALSIGYPTGIVGENVYVTGDNYLDFDRVIAENDTAVNGSNLIMSLGYNSHDWYGAVSSLNTKIGDISVTGGIDGRYYKGYHYYEIEDLMGGDYFIINDGNPNRDVTTPLYKGDRYNKNYFGEVIWAGLFLQGEYVSESYSGFLSASVSESSYRRTDVMNYLVSESQTDWQNFTGYSVKGGLNYNINKNHNIFINSGYFSKAPFFSYVFISNNELNPNPNHEKVFSAELGYGLNTSKFNADLTFYRTMWMNKSYSERIRGTENTMNLIGLNALHQGIELEMNYSPIKKVEIRGMVSFGDWRWNNDAVMNEIDPTGELVNTRKLYSAGIHVGDAAQTTAALGFDAEVLPKFKIGMDYNYYDRLFGKFGIEGRVKEEDAGKDSWLMPDYHLVDFNAKYRFKMGKLKTTLYAKVNNILDTEYFSESKPGDGLGKTPVYYGYGRTWSLGLKIKF